MNPQAIKQKGHRGRSSGLAGPAAAQPLAPGSEMAPKDRMTKTKKPKSKLRRERKQHTRKRRKAAQQALESPVVSGTALPSQKAMTPKLQESRAQAVPALLNPGQNLDRVRLMYPSPPHPD